MTYDDLPFLVDMETRQEVHDRVVNAATSDMMFVEIGTYMGGTIGRLASKIKEKKIHPLIYCVDKWICDDIAEGHRKMHNTYDHFYEKFIDNMTKIGVLDLIRCLKMDSIEASKEFKDQSIDFIFIDGCHSYPYVKNELIVWLPKMKPNSILCGHDFPVPQIKQAVNETIGLNKVYSVTNNGSYVYKIGDGLKGF